MEKLETTVGKALADTAEAGTAKLEEAYSAGGTAAAKDTAVASGADSFTATINKHGFSFGAQGRTANTLAGGAALSATGYAADQDKNNEKQTQEYTDELDSN